MRLVVFGDAHLKHSGKEFDVADITLPNGTDGVLVAGDLVDDPIRENIDEGRRFLEELASRVPVVSVPGNHDPLDVHEEMLAPVDDARVLHDEVTSIAGFDVAGYGCAQFDQGPAIDVTEFSALDPRTEADRRYAAVDGKYWQSTWTATSHPKRLV